MEETLFTLLRLYVTAHVSTMCLWPLKSTFISPCDHTGATRVFMKLYQNVFLHGILYEPDTRSKGQIIQQQKTVNTLGTTSLLQSFETLSTGLILDHVWYKNRPQC